MSDEIEHTRYQWSTFLSFLRTNMLPHGDRTIRGACSDTISINTKSRDRWWVCFHGCCVNPLVSMGYMCDEFKVLPKSSTRCLALFAFFVQHFRNPLSSVDRKHDSPSLNRIHVTLPSCPARVCSTPVFSSSWWQAWLSTGLVIYACENCIHTDTDQMAISDDDPYATVDSCDTSAAREKRLTDAEI